MSEQPTEDTEPEALALGDDPASQMAAIMGFLAPDAGAPPAEPGAAEGDSAAEEPGQQPAAGEGAGAGAADGGAPADGDAGQPAVPGDGSGDPGGSGAGSVEPGSHAGTVDAASLNEKWGELSTAFETSQQEILQQGALAEVREEYGKYFEALQKHPRMLVGEEVPSTKDDGTERLRDAQDARDWQEAVKHLLVQEIDARAGAKADELKDVFATVHSSIDLFRNNADLIPRTKQFDAELANEFATLVKDYELRSDGKLIGYSVPVQPMINQLRSQIASRRTAAAAGGRPPAAAAPSAQQQKVAEQPRTPQGQWTGPQGGISSKAGSSSDGDEGAAGIMEAFFRQNGMTI